MQNSKYHDISSHSLRPLHFFKFNWDILGYLFMQGTEELEKTYCDRFRITTQCSGSKIQASSHVLLGVCKGNIFNKLI